MRARGFRITGARKGENSVKDGVEFLKSYDIVVHPDCQNTIDELSLYSNKTDKQTGDVLPVLEDKKNHVIEALRYGLARHECPLVQRLARASSPVTSIPVALARLTMAI
jgi:phage terminase large subunit